MSIQFKKIEEVKYLVVHCSATSAKQDVDIAEIDRWHRLRGFWMVGYHYFIKRDGTLEVGRKEEEMGAHAEGFNHESIAICMAGGVDRVAKGYRSKPEDNFTDAQYATLRALLFGLQHKYPHADILGHRDLPGVDKACPSFDVKEWWRNPSMDPSGSA